MREHPLRHELLDEIHARSFSDFTGRGRFIRYIYLTPDGDKPLLDYISTFLKANGQAAIQPDMKFLRIDFDGYAMRVERHTEFLTISMVEKGLPKKAGLAPGAFDPSALPYLPFDWISQMPCDVFHAIWLEVGGKPEFKLTQHDATNILASRAAPGNLISHGAGQLHLSFDRDENGFTRAVLFNNKIVAARMGRLLQRVMELETYRMLAMMGLATTKSYGAVLNKMDNALNALTQDISATIESPNADMRGLLSKLSVISATLEKTSAETGFRMSATKAYRDLFMARLHGLQLSYLEGHQGLVGFTDRRMMPAMQTCEAFSKRLERTTARASRAGQLIQTETESKIQEQNRDLLMSMDRRASTQIKLQQAVEGFSIAALTYYGVGLVGHLVAGLPLAELGLDATIVKALAVPIIGITVWTLVRRASRRVTRDDNA